MLPVLRKPKRPLPRKFNRPVTLTTRLFVARRHTRHRSYRLERHRRFLRRVQAALRAQMTSARRWIPLIAAGFCAVLVAVALFSPLFRVRAIRIVRGEGRVDVAQVLQSLAPLYGRHLLFVSRHDVEERVQSAVPGVAEVSVAKQYPSQLQVRIVLRPVIARLRIEQPGPVAASGSLALTGSGAAASIAEFHYLTDEGLLVTSINSLQDQALPVIRIVDWGVYPVHGARILSPQMLERLQHAEQALTREFGLQIKSRTVYLRAREFHLQTAGPALWFDERTPLVAQMQRFRTFLKSVKLQDVKNYIDLRLTGRVVYK